MNNNLAKLSRIFNNQRPSAGFTLIELLVAALLTTVVTSLAGTGVVAITENNKKAQAETERRVELNRALEFISDEVRQAKFVAKDASATLAIVAPSFDRSGKTPVLTLQIPGVAERVIYYIAPKPAGSPWLGPNIIYRWGPNLDINGTYTNPNTPGDWNDNVATADPIADLVVNTALSADPCPSVGSGWTLTQPLGSVQGFYACVDPDGRIAKPHLLGKLRDAYGNSRTSSFDVTTKTFARSFEVAAAQGAAALAAAETAAAALAAAKAAAATAATAAQTAVSNLGTLQTAANNAATALATATANAATAAANAAAAAAAAAANPTAANYTAAANAATALANAERAAATAATNAATAANAATALQEQVARTAANNAAAQKAARDAAIAAQTAAASASQGSTEQAATDYATTAQTTATQAVTDYNNAAQTAVTAATAAQAAVEQNAATLANAPTTATTNTADAIAADQRATDLRTLAQQITDAQRFTTNNGTVTFTQNSSVQIQVLGGDITCGEGGAVIPTTITPNVTSGGITTSTTLTSTTRSLDVPAGSTLTLTGAAPRNTGICSFFGGSSYNSATNSAGTNIQQVLTLRNGDTPPIFSPFGNQKATIESFLTKYINPATGKVTIDANQVIYLFELGAAYNATTRSPAYDMQDLVVLATVGATTKTVPTAPTITATVSGTNVRLSWNAVTHADAYELYKCDVAKTGSCTPITLVNEVSSGVTQNVSSIGGNNKICFAVKAKNGLGTSNLSNILSFNKQGGTQTP